MDLIQKSLITVLVLIPSTMLLPLSTAFSMLGFSSLRQPDGITDILTGILAMFSPLVFVIGVAGLWFATFVAKGQWPNHPWKIAVFVVCGVLSIAMCFLMEIPAIVALLQYGTKEHWIWAFVLLSPLLLGLFYLFQLFRIKPPIWHRSRL